MEEPRASVRNAADPKQVDAAKKRDNRRRERDLQNIRAVLQTREGRGFFWRYIELCHVFTTTFHQNPQIAAFNEGERAIGTTLLKDIDAVDPAAYTKMVLEAREEEKLNG